METNKLSIYLLATFFSVLITHAESKQPTYIGLLKEREINWPNWPSEKKPLSYKYTVIPLFKKDNDEWIPIDSVKEEEIDWLVVFDGRKIGNIHSRKYRQSKWIAEFGLYEVDSSCNVPRIGHRNEDFGGWADYDVPLYRPLILVSQPSYSDPQHWKPYQPSEAEILMCLPEFKKVVGKVTLCDKEHGNEPTDDYDIRKIKIGKSYRSAFEAKLINFHLDPSLFHCDAIDNGADKWFYINAKSHLEYPKISGILVDAGDYDGDGFSEFIFATGEEGGDGYVILYDHLSKSSRRSLRYH